MIYLYFSYQYHNGYNSPKYSPILVLANIPLGSMQIAPNPLLYTFNKSLTYFITDKSNILSNAKKILKFYKSSKKFYTQNFLEEMLFNINEQSSGFKIFSLYLLYSYCKT